MRTTFDPSRPRGLPRPHTCLWADSLVDTVADGADVDVEWPNLGTDATTGVTATASTRRPTLWHGVANGHPALEFDGTQDLMKSSSSFSPVLDSAVEPYTFVAVVLSRGASLSAAQYVFDSFGSTPRNYLYCKGAGFEDEWYLGSNARGARHPGEWDLIHSIQRINTDGLSEVDVNGVGGTDASYGGTTFTGWTVGGRYSTQSFLDGYLALLMCFEGDPAADYPDAWQRFLAEIASYYSIPSYTAPAQDDQGIGASGGTVTEVDGWTYHTFTEDGMFCAHRQMLVEYLCVGGGGGGGSGTSNRYGGGGGAGGLLTGEMAIVGTHQITVGAGGSGGPPTSTQGSNGGDSSIGSLVTALGGGGGGGNNSGGLDGGSGGGAGGNSGLEGLGTVGQGHDGGNGTGPNNSSQRAGGGGGAGGPGTDGVASTSHGEGGPGLEVWGTTYATGGNTWGSGSADGAANTGDGGGGASGSAVNGKVGGSGIVKIRWKAV